MDLHTLPAPYPDETWYSIVARYHRKSGNIKSIMTRKDLFGESARKAINPLAMDYTVADYIRLHGPTLGTAEECFSKYTLAPYQMRYYSKERKEEVLERVLSENEQEKTSVFTSHMHSRNQTKLRYCPLCLKEDVEKYGESYWHKAHQIWIVDKCYKHGCNLLDSTVSLARAAYHLTCADELSCQNDEVTCNESPFDNLTQYAVATLNAPFDFHSDSVVDALIYASIDAKYGKFYSKGFMCNASELYKSIQERFGKDFVKEFFTSDNGGATIRRVFYSDWNSRVEPVILVAAFFQIPMENLFDKIDREASIKEELIKCSKHNVWWPRNRLAQHLGIKANHLNLLAKELGIKPFWEDSPRTENMICYKATFHFTEKEIKAIETRIKKLHMASKKDFFAYCVKKEVGLVE